MNNDSKVECYLKRIWELADKIVNIDSLYERDVCEIQRIVEIMSSQPERLNPETCKNGCFNTREENRNSDDSWNCEKCDALITRCDSLNSMET